MPLRSHPQQAPDVSDPSKLQSKLDPIVREFAPSVTNNNFAKKEKVDNKDKLVSILDKQADVLKWNNELVSQQAKTTEETVRNAIKAGANIKYNLAKKRYTSTQLDNLYQGFVADEEFSFKDVEEKVKEAKEKLEAAGAKEIDKSLELLRKKLTHEHIQQYRDEIKSPNKDVMAIRQNKFILDALTANYFYADLKHTNFNNVSHLGLDTIAKSTGGILDAGAVLGNIQKKTAANRTTTETALLSTYTALQSASPEELKQFKDGLTEVVSTVSKAEGIIQHTRDELSTLSNDVGDVANNVRNGAVHFFRNLDKPGQLFFGDIPRIWHLFVALAVQFLPLPKSVKTASWAAYGANIVLKAGGSSLGQQVGNFGDMAADQLEGAFREGGNRSYDALSGSVKTALNGMSPAEIGVVGRASGTRFETLLECKDNAKRGDLDDVEFVTKQGKLFPDEKDRKLIKEAGLNITNGFKGLFREIYEKNSIRINELYGDKMKTNTVESVVLNYYLKNRYGKTRNGMFNPSTSLIEIARYELSEENSSFRTAAMNGGAKKEDYIRKEEIK